MKISQTKNDFKHKIKPATIFFHALIKTKCCGIFPRQTNKTRKNTDIHTNCTFNHFQKQTKNLSLKRKFESQLYIQKIIFTRSITKDTKRTKTHWHKQTFSLFTIFKNICEIHHSSDILKTQFTHKQFHFSSKPFATHSNFIQRLQSHIDCKVS